MRTADAESRAYSEILRAIVTQKYAPGDHLAEAKVAEDLNMSRTPVRSALKKMIAGGLLEYSKNIGCRIPVLTPHDMENVFRVRATLESQAAGLAAEQASEADIDHLLSLLEQEKECYTKGEMAQYTKINESLHIGIASLANNQYLERFVSQLFWRAELYVFFFDRFYLKAAPGYAKRQRDPSQSRSCREHDALVHALASRDAQEATNRMRAHVVSTYDNMMLRQWPPCA